MLICAPIGAWLLDRSMLEMGALAVMLSTVAMIWNMLYNAAFDRFWPVSRVARTVKVRALHAGGFETGFVLIGVPIAALMLDVSLVQAFCWRSVSSPSCCPTPWPTTGSMTCCVSAC